MITGFAKAGQALQDESYIQRAITAANFVKKHLYNPTAETLLRSCYKGTDGNTSQMWVLQLCIFKAIGFINAFFCKLCGQWISVVTCHKDGNWGSVSGIVRHLSVSLPPTMISSFLVPDGGLQACPAFPASAVRLFVETRVKDHHQHVCLRHPDTYEIAECNVSWGCHNSRTLKNSPHQNQLHGPYHQGGVWDWCTFQHVEWG